MPSVAELLSSAIRYHRAGRLLDAARIYGEIARVQPSNVDALHLMGTIAAQNQDLDIARAMILEAVRLRPDRADFYASLGNVFLQQGNSDDGVFAYKHALMRTWFDHWPWDLDQILAHAGAPPASKTDTEVEWYVSQYWQDLYLDRWVFHGARGGVFVDIGAHDGETLSNSYFFETRRGWSGICVEPNPDVFERLKQVRHCHALNCCVSNVSGSLEFLKVSGYSEMLSGVLQKYDPEHRQRIDSEIAEHGGSQEVISVPSRTFSDIVGQYGISEVTYLSVDTEGSEIDILESIDFNETFVHAITVECNFDHLKERMATLMATNGFQLAKEMHCDLLFLNRKSPYYQRYVQDHGKH